MGREQRTLVFVKPGHLEKSAEIFDYLDSNLKGDFYRRRLQQFKPSWEQMDEFYVHTRGKIFHIPTIDRYTKEGIVLSIYSGENIIKRVKFWVGDTDPSEAEPWTVRGRFGTDSLEKAYEYEKRRFLENVIHASANELDAERELKMFKNCSC